MWPQFTSHNLQPFLAMQKQNIETLNFFYSSTHFLFIYLLIFCYFKTGASKWYSSIQKRKMHLAFTLSFFFSFFVYSMIPFFRFTFVFNILRTQKLSPFPLQLGLKYCRWKLFKTSLLTFQIINIVFSYKKNEKNISSLDPFCCFFSLDDLTKFLTLIIKNSHMDLDNLRFFY